MGGGRPDQFARLLLAPSDSLLMVAYYIRCGFVHAIMELGAMLGPMGCFKNVVCKTD